MSVPLRWLRRQYALDINYDPKHPPQDKSKEMVAVSDIQEWTWFCWIHQAIHLKAFPKESYSMATYMYYILQIAERKGRFDVAFEYDGQHRIRPAEYLLPWQFSTMTFTASVRPTSNRSIRNSPFVLAIMARSCHSKPTQSTAIPFHAKVPVIKSSPCPFNWLA